MEEYCVFGFVNTKSLLKGEGFIIQNFIPILVITDKDTFVPGNGEMV